MKMIEPRQKDEALLSDIRGSIVPSGQWRMWWLGQSGFLIKWEDRYCLLDPYLSDSLTTKYANTDKPHVRMTERVLAPDRLDFVDVVTSSHNHTDHLDGETLRPLARVNQNLAMIIPEANRSFVAKRLQCDPAWPMGMTDGSRCEVMGFEFFGIPAAHEDLETDELGQHRFMGYIISFGEWSVYHSGDTLLYEGMVERLRPWNVDVALLPINGRDPSRRVAGNLNGAQAAKLAKDIGARLVIPCHYDMFTFNTASPDGLTAACSELSQCYYVMKNGEGLDSKSLQPLL